MRTVAATLLLGLVTGCTPPGPMTLKSMTPLSFDTAFSCSVKQTTQLGYTVIDRKTPGEVYAEKKTRTVSIPGVGDKVILDHLIVSISPADSAIRDLQVTAGTVQVIVVHDVEQRRELRPSDQVRTDAGIVMTACKKQPG